MFRLLNVAGRAALEHEQASEARLGAREDEPRGRPHRLLRSGRGARLTGGLPRAHPLVNIAAALDDPGPPKPVTRPEPCPPSEQRPDRISVTAVDRLKAQ